MRQSRLRTEFDRFVVQINQITDLLVKIYEAKAVVVPPDKEREILTEVLLSEKKQIHVAWEFLVEEVFVECLYRNPQEYSRRKGLGLPKRLTRDICRGLISGLGYFDFRDMSDAKGKARRFLSKSDNPFKEVDSKETRKMDEFCIVRNYVAHRSGTARQSLERMYKDTYQMKFREPGDFLLDTVRFVELGVRGTQTRFADYVNAFMKAADKMALFLSV